MGAKEARRTAAAARAPEAGVAHAVAQLHLTAARIRSPPAGRELRAVLGGVARVAHAEHCRIHFRTKFAYWALAALLAAESALLARARRDGTGGQTVETYLTTLAVHALRVPLWNNLLNLTITNGNTNGV